MVKFFKSGIVAIMAIMGSVAQSFAALDLTGVTVDTTSVEALALIVITGLAVLWGIRKVVKTINRS